MTHQGNRILQWLLYIFCFLILAKFSFFIDSHIESYSVFSTVFSTYGFSISLLFIAFFTLTFQKNKLSILSSGTAATIALAMIAGPFFLPEQAHGTYTSSSTAILLLGLSLSAHSLLKSSLLKKPLILLLTLLAFFISCLPFLPSSFLYPRLGALNNEMVPFITEESTTSLIILSLLIVLYSLVPRIFIWKKLPPVILAAVISLSGISLVTALWQELTLHEEKLLETLIEKELSTVGQTISDTTIPPLAALQRMSQRWKTNGGTEQKIWNEDATYLLKDHSALMAIEWIDSTYHIRWVEPLAGNDGVIGLNVTFSEERKRVVEDAASGAPITLSPPLDLLQGYRAFIAYIPLYVNNRFDGFIAGVFDYKSNFNKLLSDEFQQDFSIEIFDEGKTLFTEKRASTSNHTQWQQLVHVPIYNRTWTVAIQPTDYFFSHHKSLLPEITFIGGILFSLLAGIAIYYSTVSGNTARLLQFKSSELQKSEAALSAILETAPDGIISVDENGIIRAVNHTAIHIFGYDDEELIDRPVNMLIPKHLHHRHSVDMQSFAHSGSSKTMAAGREVVGLHKDGRKIPLEIGLSRTLMPDNSIHVTAAIRDISQLKRIEGSLANVGRILENSLNEVYIFDADTLKFLQVNRGARENLGYTMQELSAMTPLDIKPEFTLSRFRQHISPLLDGSQEKLIFETVHQRVDASLYNVEAHLQLAEYQDTVVFVAMILDTTTRKSHEQLQDQLLRSLAESNELNVAIMNSTSHLIVSTDPNGMVTSFNQAAERTLGYSADEIIGKQTPMLWHDNNEIKQRAEELSQELRQPIKSGFDVYAIKPREQGPETSIWHYTRKDGSQFPASLTVTCILNKNQEITGYLGITEDITNRKKAELEREKLIDNLINSNEELARFAYVCSHDLQEPLRMITSFSEKLQTHIGNSLDNDDKGKKYFNYIINGATQAQTLIHDILSYSSITSDTSRNETFDTNEIVTLIKANNEEQLEANHGQITSDELPKITGNKTQIYQLFQNLINNSLKYQAADTVPYIHISVTDDHSHWHFSIKDNGIGIEQRHIGKIFDVFKRLHRKTQYAGTGVGLSICKKVVERHGGKIWVDSEKGVGSTFHFTLLKNTEEETQNDNHQTG